MYWIRFHVRYPAFGIPTYDADHEVAVDADSGEPRLWRATDRENPALLRPKQTTEVKIDLWETLPDAPAISPPPQTATRRVQKLCHRRRDEVSAQQGRRIERV